MVEELKKAKEIAIDLEHHDVHSYHGLVSLMQISTRDKDWVVDTLQPWREDLQQLNEVFTDPKILKVLHGSTMDIVWLQRDLGLYVVGMFDTYHAAVALGYPKRSLKFLLEKLVHYDADKKYQMADWRIRPLTEEMLKYARADTHYLLYVYDCMRNELVENSTPQQNLVDYVLERSKTEALQRYERPVYDVATGQGAGGWYDLLSRNSGFFSKEQFAVFKAVHQWRDQVARAEDEGLQCVFPRHALFKVASVMPVDRHTLFKTLSPVTLLVKDRISELLEIIKKAKIEGATGPELRDVIKPKKTVAEAAAVSTKSPPPAIETADKLVNNNNLLSVVRADTSQFWGAALQPQEVAVVPAKYKVAASFEALRLSVPIPPMPVTVSEVQQTIKHVNSAVPSPAASPSVRKADKRDEIFTVKEVAPRHKRKVTIEEESSESDASTSSSGSSGSDNDSEDSEDSEDSSEEDEVEQHPAKKPRREAPTPKKKQKEEEGTTPFDYRSATPVLHSEAMAAAASGSAEASQKKRFNPYAKSLNAPSGMRKQKKEIGGRTFTFNR
jgi:exosome complex exonuclease RRP6